MKILKPTSEIKANLGIQPNGRVQRFFTHECRRQMDRFVPYDTGNLRQNVREGTDYIDYNQPYAHYQYKGLSVKGKPLNYKTSGTGSYWDKRMWTAKSNEVVNATQRYLERG